ncbi:sigma-24 [Dictyobacter alpinus]|uniref:Sigma-24 n=1 Tax=Dictyobacter alpinus TaxID=2014873 RepID=A0A402BBK9_9CHLR|nr:sigma-70 family RNA polymerase sigma factor [Dictyobacter alpinus]GCE28719.1 sigma-24 [Dictyobacter alpinus]
MQPGNNRVSATDSPYALLYERHAAVILIYIRRRLATDADAEDILLDVFLAVLEKEDFLLLKEDEQLTWLYRVAHNKCADFYRRARRRPTISLEQTMEMIPFYADEAREPEQIVVRRDEQRLLYEQIATLPVQHQKVVLLRFGAGMRCVDIARMLKLREGTVRGWLSRALNLLRIVYENEREDS